MEELKEILFGWLESLVELAIAVGLAYLILNWLFDLPVSMTMNLIFAVIIIQSCLGMGRGLTAFIWAIGKVFSNVWKEYKVQ